MFFTSRYHLEGAPGERFFGELQAHPEWRASASLPVGHWNAMDVAVEFTSMSKTYSMAGWRMSRARSRRCVTSQRSRPVAQRKLR